MRTLGHCWQEGELVGPSGRAPDRTPATQSMMRVRGETYSVVLLTEAKGGGQTAVGWTPVCGARGGRLLKCQEPGELGSAFGRY